MTSEAKVVLCFGDSNTWGFDPATQQRFPAGLRWPRVLAQALGPSIRVIEEGLNGRTTVWDDPLSEGRNGRTYFLPCLQTHQPLDLVILMLGTNDLKKRFSATALDVARGAGVLLDISRRSAAGPGGAAPAVLLVAPPPFAPLQGQFAEMFEGAEPRSRGLAAHYERVAAEAGASFFDAGTVTGCSPIDGIHLDSAGHQRLGKALAAEVSDCLASDRD